MKVTVNQDMCISCGACEAVCPNVFEVGQDGAEVKTDVIAEADVKDATDAMEGCPVAAISEVQEETEEIAA